MKGTDTAVKTRTRTRSGQRVNVGTETNKLAVGTLAVAAGLVGAWVITAFVAGIMASGGIIPMVSNWIQAVFG